MAHTDLVQCLAYLEGSILAAHCLHPISEIAKGELWEKRIGPELVLL